MIHDFKEKSKEKSYINLDQIINGKNFDLIIKGKISEIEPILVGRLSNVENVRNEYIKRLEENNNDATIKMLKEDIDKYFFIINEIIEEQNKFNDINISYKFLANVRTLIITFIIIGIVNIVVSLFGLVLLQAHWALSFLLVLACLVTAVWALLLLYRLLKKML